MVDSAMKQQTSGDYFGILCGLSVDNMGINGLDWNSEDVLLFSDEQLDRGGVVDDSWWYTHKHFGGINEFEALSFRMMF